MTWDVSWEGSTCSNGRNRSPEPSRPGNIRTRMPAYRCERYSHLRSTLPPLGVSAICFLKAVLVTRWLTGPSHTIARVPTKRPGTHLHPDGDTSHAESALGGLFEGVDKPFAELVEFEVAT